MIEVEKLVYRCEICGNDWDDRSTAEVCERSHRVNFEVVDMKYDRDPEYDTYGFPTLIVVDDPTHSGCAAEYRLVREGSVEDFEPYHPPEFYERD